MQGFFTRRQITFERIERVLRCRNQLEDRDPVIDLGLLDLDRRRQFFFRTHHVMRRHLAEITREHGVTATFFDVARSRFRRRVLFGNGFGQDRGFSFFEFFFDDRLGRRQIRRGRRRRRFLGFFIRFFAIVVDRLAVACVIRRRNALTSVGSRGSALWRRRRRHARVAFGVWVGLRVKLPLAAGCF